MRSHGFQIITALVAIALVAISPAPQATAETTSGRPGGRGSGGAASRDGDGSMSMRVLNSGENEEPTNIVLYGKVFEPGRVGQRLGSKMPTTDQVYKHVCGSKGGPLCQNFDEVKKSYEESAKALGVPAPLMMCMTYQESDFGRNPKDSGAGARGMAQFIDDTAKEAERQIKEDKNYREAWEKYKEKTGCNLPFTAANIQGKPYAKVHCVALFAMAWHMRKDLVGPEREFQNLLGSQLQPSSKELENVFKYILASYNAGPANGKKFKDSGYNYSALPKAEETKPYIEKILGCMKESSTKPDTSGERS